MEGNLATHPHLQHHDLSSLFLEGLPPKRKKALGNDIARSKKHKSDIDHNKIASDSLVHYGDNPSDVEDIPTEPGIAEEHVRAAGSGLGAASGSGSGSVTPKRKKTAEQEEFDPAEAVRYLRQRMPEV
jgi:hypothetical protein